MTTHINYEYDFSESWIHNFIISLIFNTDQLQPQVEKHSGVKDKQTPT